MSAKDTVIIVTVLVAIAASFALFMLNVIPTSSPNPPQPTWNRADDVVPEFDANVTAIVTLKQGQKSGPVIVTRIKPHSEVQIDKIESGGFGTTTIEPLVMRAGETTAAGCYYTSIALLNVTADTATFELRGGGYCPICWYQVILTG